MNRTDLYSMSLGEIAVRIPAAWDLFERESSDFCYCGYQDLSQWAKEKGKDLDTLADEILALKTARNAQWARENSLTVICDHILREYHLIQRRQITKIQAAAAECAQAYADNSDFQQIKTKIDLFFADLLNHFDHEERELFVELREIDIFHPQEPAQAGRMQFGQISNQIRHWEVEHMETSKAGEALLCSVEGFLPEAQRPACIKALSTELSEFFQLLRHHIHFENFVLLPACMRVEQALCL